MKNEYQKPEVDFVSLIAKEEITSGSYKNDDWVDGEIGARAFQMPVGWPVGSPIALWDTNDSIIYLKSINQLGAPSQLYKIHYTVEEQPGFKMLPSTGAQVSGDTQIDMANFATKDDIEKIKNEIRDMLKQNQPAGNQSGQVNQNRGGNR